MGPNASPITSAVGSHTIVYTDTAAGNAAEASAGAGAGAGPRVRAAAERDPLYSVIEPQAIAPNTSGTTGSLPPGPASGNQSVRQSRYPSKLRSAPSGVRLQYHAPSTSLGVEDNDDDSEAILQQHSRGPIASRSRGNGDSHGTRGENTDRQAVPARIVKGATASQLAGAQVTSEAAALSCGGRLADQPTDRVGNPPSTSGAFKRPSGTLMPYRGEPLVKSQQVEGRGATWHTGRGSSYHPTQPDDAEELDMPPSLVLQDAGLATGPKGGALAPHSHSTGFGRFSAPSSDSAASRRGRRLDPLETIRRSSSQPLQPDELLEMIAAAPVRVWFGEEALDPQLKQVEETMRELHREAKELQKR